MRHFSHTGATALPAVSYVDQRSAELTFYLFERPAPRESVQVLAEREVALAGGRVTLAIVGSSHFLEVRAGDEVLCELLACPRPGLDGASTRAQIGDLPAMEHRLRLGSLEYRFDMWRRSSSPREFEENSQLLSSEGPGRLRFVFPRGESARGAITHLEWQVEGHRLTVATQHTFPGELTIVHSRSMIELAKKGALP